MRDLARHTIPLTWEDEAILAAQIRITEARKARYEDGWETALNGFDEVYLEPTGAQRAAGFGVCVIEEDER